MKRTILLLASCISISLALTCVAEDRYLYAFVPVAGSDGEMERFAAWVQDVTAWETLGADDKTVEVRRHRRMRVDEVRALPVVTVDGAKYYRLCIDVTKPSSKQAPLKFSSEDISKLTTDVSTASAVTADSKEEAEAKAKTDLDARVR